MFEAITNPIDTCITLIAFRRPKLLFTTLNALANNIDIDNTPLYIYIDGHREQVANEKALVDETETLAKEFKWKGKKEVIRASENKGLRNAVRYAIDSSLEKHESTIVVEDDIVTSPFFFRFMLKGLSYFRNDERVSAISGYVFNFDRKKFSPTEVFCLKLFLCWGWATWRRSWSIVCWDSNVLYEKLKTQGSFRDLNVGLGDLYSGMLEDNCDGLINSWAILAYVSFYLNDMLCIFPPETLTNNTGWRKTEHSTHMYHDVNLNPPLAYIDINLGPDISLEISQSAWKAMNDYFYPPSTKIKLIIFNILFLFFPFLRTLKRKLKNKKYSKSH